LVGAFDYEGSGPEASHEGKEMIREKLEMVRKANDIGGELGNLLKRAEVFPDDIWDAYVTLALKLASLSGKLQMKAHNMEEN
jgi:hypothetical protein